MFGRRNRSKSDDQLQKSVRGSPDKKNDRFDDNLAHLLGRVTLDKNDAGSCEPNGVQDSGYPDASRRIDAASLETHGSKTGDPNVLGFCQSIAYGMLYAGVFGITTEAYPLRDSLSSNAVCYGSHVNPMRFWSSSLHDSGLLMPLYGMNLNCDGNRKNSNYDHYFETSVDSSARSFVSEEKSGQNQRSLPLKVRFFMDPGIFYDRKAWIEEKRHEFDELNFSAELPWAERKVVTSKILKNDAGLTQSQDSIYELCGLAVFPHGQGSNVDKEGSGVKFYMPQYQVWIDVDPRVLTKNGSNRCLGAENATFGRKRAVSFAGFENLDRLAAKPPHFAEWPGADARDFSPEPPESGADGSGFPFPFDCDELTFSQEEHELELERTKGELLRASRRCEFKGAQNGGIDDLSSLSLSGSPVRKVDDQSTAEEKRRESKRRRKRRLSIDSARDDFFRLSTCDEGSASLFDPLSSAARRARDFLPSGGAAPFAASRDSAGGKVLQARRGSASSGYKSGGDLLSSAEQSIRQNSWTDLTAFGRLRAGTIGVERPCDVAIRDFGENNPGFFSLPDSQGFLSSRLDQKMAGTSMFDEGALARNAVSSVDPDGADLPDITTLRYFYNLGVSYYLEHARREQILAMGSYNLSFLGGSPTQEGSPGLTGYDFRPRLGTAEGRGPGMAEHRRSYVHQGSMCESERAQSFLSSTDKDFQSRSIGGAVPVDPCPLEGDLVPNMQQGLGP